MASIDPSRVPVIIGVGQVSDRTDNADEALETVGLMAAALRRADRDAGGNWLSRLDSLFVIDHVSFRKPQGSPHLLAAELGIQPRLLGKGAYPGGETPILLLNEAANRIGAGEIRVAAIAGGEALRTESRRGAPPWTESGHRRTTAPPYCARYGLSIPTNIYPLYENAVRAARGESLDDAQRESADIWSRSSQVAAENPDAWLRKAKTAEEILDVSPSNRPVAFPYSKLMVANSSINMGAAFIVTSLAEARAAGIAEDRIIYVGLGAAANEADDVLLREGYDRSLSMETSIERTLSLNGVSASQLDFVELYSCFPIIPKLARRILDWPSDKPTTVYGGLTFGGGPIAAPMAHAVACMVGRLREGGERGLIFANGGYANHNHTILLTRSHNPAAVFPQNFDFQEEADAKRGPAPRFEEDHVGPGSIESYTVLYDKSGDVRFGVIVARDESRQVRFLAKVPPDDTAGIAFLTDGMAEPVGSRGTARLDAGGDVVWHRD